MSTEGFASRHTGPLTGVRVLDMTHALAGALSTLLLADLGADVIKVERPGGEPLRALEVDGFQPFRVLNRSKRSIVVDVGHDDGAALVRSLLARVDVFVENFRPGVLERFGLGYDQVAGDCEQLVYCSITGYGEDVRYAEWPGFDLAAQAMSGLMRLVGGEGRPPARIGAPVSSIGAGVFAVTGILAAYAHRLSTGTGQRVTSSLLDSARTFTLLDAARPAGRDRVPLVSPEDVFPTRDGWIVVSAGDERSWRRLCRLLEGGAGLESDKRFMTPALRRSNHRELCVALAGAFDDRETGEWLSLFHAAGVACAPVRDVDPAPPEPFGLSATPPSAGSDVPVAGEDTQRALADLGVSQSHVTDLIKRAVVRQADEPPTAVPTIHQHEGASS